MSEYIVKTDGEFGMYRSGLFVLEDEYMAVPAEPLIRCRDCRAMSVKYGNTGIECWMSGEPFTVEPDGYCAWAKPKVGVRE